MNLQGFDDTLVSWKRSFVKFRGVAFIEEEMRMSITAKRIIILVVIIAVAFCLGRLAVRAVMNLLLGGTLFGGNFL